MGKALDKAIRQIRSPGAMLRAAEREAARKAAIRANMKYIDDVKAGRINPLANIFENMPGKYEEGGDVKRPTPTYKSMDMGGDILDSYLAGLGNSKDTTVRGGGSKKPKPIKKAKGGLVSPRKAQGMYRG